MFVVEDDCGRADQVASEFDCAVRVDDATSVTAAVDAGWRPNPAKPPVPGYLSA